MANSGDGPKGFSDVDAQSNPTMLIDGMDATADWPAVQTLQWWERERLRVEPGHAVLDVGCGPGHVIIDLARAIAPGGRAVGVDYSEQMLAVARQRAQEANAPVEFIQGDAAKLDLADDSFDIVRSERTLQWLEEPAAAVAEMVRVTRPGGRVGIIDSDFRTLVVDPCPPVVQRFMDALSTMRGDSRKVGGRLLNLLREEGLRDLESTAATHQWLSWNPDAEAMPRGFMPLRMVGGELVRLQLLPAPEAEEAVTVIEDAGRRDRIFLSLTMFAATGVVP